RLDFGPIRGLAQHCPSSSESDHEPGLDFHNYYGKRPALPEDLSSRTKPRICETGGVQHAWVSLTPALSPRERENRRQRVGKSETRGIVERPDVLLPLPKGEG